MIRTLVKMHKTLNNSLNSALNVSSLTDHLFSVFALFFSLDFGLAILNGLVQLEIVRLIAVGSKMNSMLKEYADVRKAFLGRSESLSRPEVVAASWRFR